MQVLQQQEQEAVGEEDYERAEDLQHQCQALEEVIRHSHSLLLPNDHPALRSLLKELQSLYQQERVEREGVIREQQRLIAQQEERVACARGHRAQWEADRLRKVQEERSKLDRDLGHLHLDKDHLFKRETCLAEQIAEGTVHLRQSRDSLMEDRARVQEEIESLEAKLSALRLRENIFSEAILKKDREMETVTAGFKDEQSALEKEKGTLEGVELELRRRREQLDNEEQRLAGRMEEVKMTEESETRLLVDLREDLSKQEDAISNLEDKDGFTLAEIWLENKSTPLSERREKLLKQKEAAQLKYEKVQKATSSLLQSQTRVVSLRKRVSDTEGHIASLTETKQLAVSGRNFAEAKRLTEEIKQLTAEGQSIQKEMEEVSKSNEERSETVKTMMEDAERMQEEINEEERKTELMIKDNLVEHIANVRDRLQSISSSSLMRTLLKAELASSALQAKLLCLKHGEPFLAEVEELTEGSVVEEIDDCPELTQEEHQVGEELPSDEGLKTAQMELERLESQLQEAVQQEDYDRAELLQRHIDAIHQQNQTLENNS
ncbi:golgin subfamily A member 6-like protein 22 isoform X2 [Acanthaster planci]|nr:golgin subfamily A member 6-like protein 22 isoform X2 [Acanthaster planci]